MVWAVALGGVAGAMLLAQACSFPDVQIDPEPSGAGGAGGSGGAGGVGGAGGGLPVCTSESQCPVSPTDCAHATCLNSACDFLNEVPGTLCGPGGTKLCDGTGDCLECLDSGDCTGEVCDTGSCVSEACANAIKDPGETDINCGGPDCAPCPNDKGCSVGKDCQSGFCRDGAGGSGGAGGTGGAGGGGTCDSCTIDDDCSYLADSYCELGGCTPKKAQGALCIGANECLSGFCPEGDNVCCADSCGGKCRSCNGTHTSSAPGICDFINSGADPFDECTLLDLPVAVCNGGGSCVLPLH